MGRASIVCRDPAGESIYSYLSDAVYVFSEDEKRINILDASLSFKRDNKTSFIIKYDGLNLRRFFTQLFDLYDRQTNAIYKKRSPALGRDKGIATTRVFTDRRRKYVSK